MRISKTQIFSLVASLLVIAGGVYWFWAFGARSEHAPEPVLSVADEKPDQTTYAKESDFLDLRGENLSSALIAAFDRSELIEGMREDIPGANGDALVLAAPSRNGKKETLLCDLNGHRFCSLFRTSASGTRLLVYGNRLAGFTGVERFPDAAHAVIATNWNLYNFSSIDRKQLNLENGELLPLLTIEMDKDRDSSSLRVSGYGGILNLTIHGASKALNLHPVGIELQDETEGKILWTMGAADLAEINQELDATEETIDAILVMPTDQDIESESLHVNLYGRPHLIDLANGAVTKEAVQ